MRLLLMTLAILCTTALSAAPIQFSQMVCSSADGGHLTAQVSTTDGSIRIQRVRVRTADGETFAYAGAYVNSLTISGSAVIDALITDRSSSQLIVAVSAGNITGPHTNGHSKLGACRLF